MNPRDPYVTTQQETTSQREQRLLEQSQRGRAYEALLGLSGWQHLSSVLKVSAGEATKKLMVQRCEDTDYLRGYAAAIGDLFQRIDETVRKGEKARLALAEMNAPRPEVE